MDKVEPFFVFQGKIPVTPMNMRTVLKQMLGICGVNPDLYNVHSFRSGCVVDLHKIHNLSIESIKKLGRWHSNSVYNYLTEC